MMELDPEPLVGGFWTEYRALSTEYSLLGADQSQLLGLKLQVGGLGGVA